MCMSILHSCKIHVPIRLIFVSGKKYTASSCPSVPVLQVINFVSPVATSAINVVMCMLCMYGFQKSIV